MSPITNPALIPPGIAGANPASAAPARSGSAQQPAEPFAKLLQDASAPSAGSEPAGSLRFSRHALQRVERRGIELDPSTLGRLEEGVGRAAGKGSRDSVVLVDGTAFVVSVANKTVLTAVPQEHMREQVFTNIDSAVIA